MMLRLSPARRPFSRHVRLFPGAILALATAGLLAVGPALAADPARNGGNAAALVQQLGDQAVKIAADRGLDREARLAAFRSLLVAGFDLPRIGRYTLGRYWKLASEAQRAEFLTLFEALIVHTYANRFNQYSGETFRTTGERPAPDGDGLIVSSIILRPATGQPIRVEWHVAPPTGAPATEIMKVKDVIVEGISMGLTQREDFGAVIQRSGGDVAGLLQQVRQRLAQP